MNQHFITLPFFIRSYSMMPSLLSGVQTVTATGFPYVARCDLFYPASQYPGSS